MINEVDRRTEGLRSLASIIAEAYRKGKTFNRVEEPVVRDDEVVGKIEFDSATNSFRYTETVSTDLLRGKIRRRPASRPRSE
ncbi:hypothetical protein B1772_03510 [Dehalococcoides mccartyi]|jgi:hypothetical protein|nr:hypothetical protein B1776_03200 [Dehalococcoides mccartyi]AQY73150.1 hypothetical protein B1772_03510 [Dehalococcoides mccartyi]